MDRCQRQVDAGRRKFLTGAGLAAAGVAAAQISTPQAKAAPPAARVDYPSNRLANVSDLKVDEPMQVAYPDADAPGVLLKFGKRLPTGVGPDGDIVGFTTICPHKGFPLSFSKSDRDAELSRPLLALRLRGRRSADVGPRHPKPPAVRTSRRRQRRHLCRRRRRTFVRAAVQRSLRGGNNGLQATNRPASDHPEGCERIQRRLPLLHRRLRLSRLHVAGQQAGRHGAGSEHSASISPATKSRNHHLVRAIDVQHRQAKLRRRAHRHQTRRQECIVNSASARCPAPTSRNSYSRQRNTQLQRLTDPMVWRYGRIQPTSPTTRLISSAASPSVSSTISAKTACSSRPLITAAPTAAENTWAPGAYFSAMK